jgi:hypothetical protein
MERIIRLHEFFEIENWNENVVVEEKLNDLVIQFLLAAEKIFEVIDQFYEQIVDIFGKLLVGKARHVIEHIVRRVSCRQRIVDDIQIAVMELVVSSVRRVVQVSVWVVQKVVVRIGDL